LNQTDINVGINSLRQLTDSRILIETSTNKEVENLGDEIRAKYEELDVNIQKLRNPRLLILNSPKERTVDNLEESLSRNIQKNMYKQETLKLNSVTLQRRI